MTGPACKFSQFDWHLSVVIKYSWRWCQNTAQCSLSTHGLTFARVAHGGCLCGLTVVSLWSHCGITVEATEADYEDAWLTLTVLLCNVACMTVVMVVDCCSITRDSDFTILGEPRRDPEHLVTSGAFTGQIQGQQTHFASLLSVNLKERQKVCRGWRFWSGLWPEGGGKKVREWDRWEERRQERQGVREKSIIWYNSSSDSGYSAPGVLHLPETMT